jgi:hypothetical protein
MVSTWVTGQTDAGSEAHGICLATSVRSRDAVEYGKAVFWSGSRRDPITTSGFRRQVVLDCDAREHNENGKKD